MQPHLAQTVVDVQDQVKRWPKFMSKMAKVLSTNDISMLQKPDPESAPQIAELLTSFKKKSALASEMVSILTAQRHLIFQFCCLRFLFYYLWAWLGFGGGGGACIGPDRRFGPREASVPASRPPSPPQAPPRPRRPAGPASRAAAPPPDAGPPLSHGLDIE